MNFLLAFIVLYIPYQAHFPLVFGTGGFNMMNLLFLLVLALIVAGKSGTSVPTPLKGRFVFFCCVLAWGFAIGQVYDSSSFGEDLAVLKNDIFYMLLYFLFFHAVRDRNTINLLFRLILAITCLVSLHVFRQALDYGIGTYIEAHRAAGPFGQDSGGSNVAAAYFVIFVPLFFAVFMTARLNPVYRLAALGCAVFGVFSMFFTYSRQAYFILPALVGLLALLRGRFLIALLLGLALLTYQVWVPSGVVDRIEMTTAEEGGDQQKYDASTESRFIFWEGAMQMITERPWGIGLNHFRREMGNYVKGYANMDAHNGYVLVATENGLLGVVAMIWLLSGCVGLGFRLERLAGASHESRLLGGAYLVSALAAMLANLFGSRVFNGEVMGNFWVMTALVARYYLLEKERMTAAALPVPVAAAAAEPPAVAGSLT